MSIQKPLTLRWLAALSNAGFRTLSKMVFRQFVGATENALINNIIRPKHGKWLRKLFSRIRYFHNAGYATACQSWPFPETPGKGH